MNLKVLQFQNKKLGERLEELKAGEVKLKEQIRDIKKQRESDFSLISVINRHWMQVMILSFESEPKINLYRFNCIVKILYRHLHCLVGIMIQ